MTSIEGEFTDSMKRLIGAPIRETRKGTVTSALAIRDETGALSMLALRFQDGDDWFDCTGVSDQALATIEAGTAVGRSVMVHSVDSQYFAAYLWTETTG